MLYMGRLSPRKGPDLVVAAAAILNERNIAVHVDLLGSVFAGYEWFEADLRRRAAESLMPGQVDFLGFQPDIWPVLAAADIVVIPSVMPEPFGNTAVEAVLGARPVVVSASGGLVEAVAGFDCAMVVPVGDPVGIADAIAAMVEDWPAFSSAALSDARIAEKRHSVELFGERLRSVIRRASMRRPRTRVR